MTSFILQVMHKMNIEGRYPLKQVRMRHCDSDTLKN